MRAADAGGLFERAGRALSSLLVGGRDDVVSSLDEELGRPHDPTFAVLSRQLASGLWESDGDSVADADEARLRATTRALIALLELGVDAAHPLHGELVRKAVAALVPLALELAPRARDAAEQALCAAWLASTGKRTRRMLRDAIRGAGLLGLEGRLDDETALR